MLTTHNFRTLNPTVSQTPLCQTLMSSLPRAFITSATTNLRRYVWVDGQTVNLSPFEIMQALEANEYYKSKKCLPKNLELETELIDPVLNHLPLYIGTTNNIKQYIAVSTAPCIGLLHEIVCREKENSNVLLSKQEVEVNPDRYFKHGQMIMEHNGVLRSFLLPKIKPIKSNITTTFSNQYAVLEFEINQCNVATGLVGVGLPALTMIGMFVTNFLQKELTEDLSFAVGFKQIEYRLKNNQNTGTINPNLLRKANLKGYLVIHTNNRSDLKSVFNILNTEFKLANHTVNTKVAYLANKIPHAYWLHEIDDAIELFLENNPGSDSLDAAFKFAEEGFLTVPVATGFALLGKPIEISHIDSIKHPHAWAETIFKSLQISYSPFNENLFFRRHFNAEKLFFHWTQEKSST